MMDVRAPGLGLFLLAACSAPSEDVSVVTSEAKKPPHGNNGGGNTVIDAGVVADASTPIDSPPDSSPPDSGTSVDAAPPPPPPPWTDACALPGAVVATFTPYGTIDASDEGATAALALPFSFTYLGRSYSRYWLTSNGELGFGDSPGGTPFGQVGCPLPDTGVARPTVYAYTVDLMAGTTCMAVTGTAPSRQLVITWKNKHLYELEGSGNGTSSVAFGVTLSEGTNAIEVAVNQVEATSPFFPTTDVINGAWAVLGLQHGTTGVSFSCREQNAPPGSRFMHQP